MYHSYFVILLDLKSCAAMQRSGGEKCEVCGCKWNTHMHVTYEMIAVTKSGEDQDAKKRYQVIYPTAFCMTGIHCLLL